MADERGKAGKADPRGGPGSQAPPTPQKDQDQPIEVPGRPDADRERDRGKAYGPGGAQQRMGDQKPLTPPRPDARSADQDAPITEPNDQRDRGTRTGPGADTTPL